MTRWPALLCCVLALGLVAAGCGDDEEEDSGGGGGAAQTEKQPAGGGGGAAPARAQVSMKNIQFDPKSVTVKKGGTVTWTNDDSVGHDVTKDSGPGARFSSGQPGALQKGDTYQRSFKTAGKFAYECTVHPGMTGTVTVK